MLDREKILDGGKIAAAQGRQASDNPYPDDSEEHDIWEEGFYYARDTDEDGEPTDD